MKFRDRKKDPPLTAAGLIIELLAQGIAIVLFGIGFYFSVSMGNVIPFIAGLGLAYLVFWILEQLKKFLEKSK